MQRVYKGIISILNFVVSFTKIRSKSKSSMIPILFEFVCFRILFLENVFNVISDKDFCILHVSEFAYSFGQYMMYVDVTDVKVVHLILS